VKRWRASRFAFAAVTGALAVTLALFLLVPLVVLVARTGVDALLEGLSTSAARDALGLSLATTAASLALAVVGGTPLAWWLTRSSGTAARVVQTLCQLPIVLPPAVAGVALLLTFGRSGALPLSLSLTVGAVVVAQLFVSAPFYVQAAAAAFGRVDGELLIAARSLGASPARVFFAVALPLAAPGLAGGAALAFARALGEFGATLMFAGNLEGVTQTLPLAIYTALESNLHVAQALSVVLLAASVGLLAAVRALGREP
jgi:molybdate transport system permease protein